MASRLMEPELSVLSHFFAGGEIVSAQLPSPSIWTAEKKLAAAVLAGALVEVRDYHDQPQYRRRVEQDLDWIMMDDAVWPFSFVRLCHLFGLEPEYVRKTVTHWLQQPAIRRQVSLHRHAA